VSERSSIEWTDSTFNPWIGCTKISPGCDNCYAERDMDKRRHVAQWGAGNPRKRTSPTYWKQPERWNARGFWQCEACGWRGENPPDEGCPSCNRLGTLAPTRRRVFCASLADFFDNEVDPAWRVDLFELIAKTPHLDWLLLTKRIGNAQAMIEQVMRSRPWNAKWPWPNVGIGATIVNQPEALRDIPKLLAVNAAWRFLSLEPLLGAVCPWADEIHAIVGDDAPGIDWVIAGGESGPHARPVHPDWLRCIRDVCKSARVPFLFKQWGEYLPGEIEHDGTRNVWQPEEEHLSEAGRRAIESRDRLHVVHAHGIDFARLGKKAAGRKLDGREHSEFPRAA
jgi:protein gp37